MRIDLGKTLLLQALVKGMVEEQISELLQMPTIAEVRKSLRYTGRNDKKLIDKLFVKPGADFSHPAGPLGPRTPGENKSQV